MRLPMRERGDIKFRAASVNGFRVRVGGGESISAPLAHTEDIAAQGEMH